MKTFIKLCSIAILGGIAVSGIPAQADTAYHVVYQAPVTSTDAFSRLDKYGNNVLTPEEYNNAANKLPFNQVDANKDGFIDRSEFYATRPIIGADMNIDDLSLIQPAAGGNGETWRHDCVYNDDKFCETRPQ